MAHTSLASLFTDIANAIRGKTGSSAALVADNFPTAIAGISTLRIATATATRTSNTVISFNVSANPVAFVVLPTDTASATSNVLSIGVTWDGSTYRRYRLSHSSSYARCYTGTGSVTKSYSNGVLTLTLGADRFDSVTYRLTYIY